MYLRSLDEIIVIFGHLTTALSGKAQLCRIQSGMKKKRTSSRLRLIGIANLPWPLQGMRTYMCLDISKQYLSLSTGTTISKL